MMSTPVADAAVFNMPLTGHSRTGPDGPKDRTMTSELQKRLRALREIAPRLNNATDEANRIVGMVDNLLKELRLGISAESHCFDARREQIVDDEDGHVTDQETCRHLAYGRVQGSYGIHILETISQAPQGGKLEHVDENRIPWSSCDRETRLEAFKELPDLLDLLLKEATNVVGMAERTAEMIKGITEGEEAAPVVPDRLEDRKPGHTEYRQL
jgi:hypothetical protein